MTNTRRTKVTAAGRMYMHAHGLRLAKHRSYCWTCRALTKHGVGRGRKPVCLECCGSEKLEE